MHPENVVVPGPLGQNLVVSQPCPVAVANTHRIGPPPPNINVGGYNFPPGYARAFTHSGEMEPYAAAYSQRVNWNTVPVFKVPDPDTGMLVPAFRYNDIHSHFGGFAGTGHLVHDVFEAAIALGVHRFTWIPIPTKVINAHDDRETYTLYGLSSHCGEQYYVPLTKAHLTNLTVKELEEMQKHVTLSVTSEVDDVLMHMFYEAVKEGEILPAHLSMVDLPITGINLADRRVTRSILDKLARMRNLSASLEREMINQNGGNLNAMQGQRLRYTLIGEVTLLKEIVDVLYGHKTAAGWHNLAALIEAMRLAGIIGMPFILHCDIDMAEGLKAFNEKGKRPINIDEIKRLMRECPNTEVIWAHAGGLGRFVKESANHIGELTALMNDPTLRHVKLDMSWSVVAEQIDKDRQSVERWAQFLSQYSDRIVFGSDTLNPQNFRKWSETYDVYEARLRPRMEYYRAGSWNQVALENYESIMVAARERVDAFVDFVLPQIHKGMLSHTAPENIDLRTVQNLRDIIFAQNVNDPRVHRTATYFALRDTWLFEPEPRKVRNFGMGKSLANAVAGTHASYELGSKRSGDPVENRNRQKEANRLSSKLNEILLALRTRRPLADGLSNKLLLAQGLLNDIRHRLGTDTPPELSLWRMRDVVDGLIRNDLPTIGIILRGLKPPLAGTHYFDRGIMPPVRLPDGRVHSEVPPPQLPAVPPPVPLRPVLGGGLPPPVPPRPVLGGGLPPPPPNPLPNPPLNPQGVHPFAGVGVGVPPPG